MRRVALALLCAAAALTGCAPSPPPQGFRADVPITSVVFFDAARFAGRWYEVAAFRPTGAPPCGGGQSDYTPRPDGSLAVTETSCARADQRARSGIATLTGPGRLTVTFGNSSDTYWMLWVDEGYRTAVIGMPSGQIGFILNRDADIPADRLRAAQDILDWNGYELSQLRLAP